MGPTETEVHAEGIGKRAPVVIDGVRRVAAAILEAKKRIGLEAIRREGKSKADGSPVTELDHLAHRLLLKEIATWPEPYSSIAIVSEEDEVLRAPEDVCREDSLFWLMDPLDGTRDLLAGEATYAMVIALMAVHGGAVRPLFEIAPEVHAVAYQYFKLPEEDERLQVVIGDGAEFIAGDNNQWDLIAVDGFDRNARAGALATQPFYEACRARLAEDGVLAVNLFGQLRGFKTQLKRISDAFDGRVLALPESDSGNVVALSARGEPMTLSITALRERAMQLKAHTGLDLVPTLKRLEKSASFLDDKVTL